VVIPDGEDKNHSVSHTLGDSSKAALVLEAGGVAESSLLLVAEVLGDRVDGGVDSWYVDVGVLDDLAVLDVEATNLAEGAGCGTVAGDELGDDCELLGSVDGHALSVEGLVTHTEGVEVTTIGIANTGVAVGGTTSIAFAASLLVDCARVRSECSSVVVGLPDIHLVAASTVLTGSCVYVGGGCGPSSRVGLD